MAFSQCHFLFLKTAASYQYSDPCRVLGQFTFQAGTSTVCLIVESIERCDQITSSGNVSHALKQLTQDWRQ